MTLPPGVPLPGGGKPDTPSQRELEHRLRLKKEFTTYGKVCLKVKGKDGQLHPLILNEAQIYVHEQLEAQRIRTGKVRALILKGRQQGVSTYVGGRFYHRATNYRGNRVYILTHEQDATDNLFAMVERYHEHCPDVVRPPTGKSNAKELTFPELDADYAVGTAGTKAVGRSQTIQLFHGSEVAFWPNAPTHFAGVVQAIPDLPGTEIILESTANGMGGEFHERWQQAERGEGDFIAIFVPWFWQDEYRRPVPPGFVMSDEEREYKGLHELDIEQIVWRRFKIAQLKDEALFQQEYPSTAVEAFQMTGHDSFMPKDALMRARKAVCEARGPLIIGYDPNRFGNDRASLARRRGRVVMKVESKGGGKAGMPGTATRKLNLMEQTGWLKKVIDDENPARVFIDVGGVGAGIYDRLDEMGYGPDGKDIVRAVNFGSEPFEPNPEDDKGNVMGGYKNRRAEMYGKSREWLVQPGGAQIPDSDVLMADAVGPGYKYDSNSRVIIESKEDMKKRGVRSPDEWDAVVLTFAEPVGPKNVVYIPPAAKRATKGRTKAGY